MSNINESLKRTDELFDKIVKIAKEQSGDDYEKYENVYMNIPGAQSVRVGKKDNGEEILIGYNLNPNDLRIRKGEFSLSGLFTVDGSEKWISLHSNTPDKPQEYYDILNNLLDNLDSVELTYDEEKTTSIDNPRTIEYLPKELKKRCNDMSLSDVRDYPTIQATVDFYALIIADYFVTRGISIIDNQEAEEKINSFKDFFGNMIVDKMTQDMSGVHIDCSQLLSDYNFAVRYNEVTRFNNFHSNTPIPSSLKYIGVSLDDFMKYYEENWYKGENLYTIETTTTLETASPINDVEKLVLIPLDIKIKLEKLSYKIISYVRKNNLFTDDKTIKLLMEVMMRFWYWVTPIIENASSKGYSIPICDDEICKIVANSSDTSWKFVNLLNIIKNYDNEKTTINSDSIKH